MVAVMARNMVVRLHAEYKPLLSVMNIVLDLSSWFDMENSIQDESHKVPCYVDVEKDAITFRTSNSMVQFKIKDLELLPISCRGLRWCMPSELHLSLQAKSAHTSGEWKNNLMTNFMEMEDSVRTQDSVLSRIQQCQNRCYCAGCGRPIFNPRSVHGVASFFKRILPLPSENWSDFADIWFCHNHQHTNSSEDVLAHDTAPPLSASQKPSPSKTLSPRPGDCLVSSLYMLVDESQVRKDTISITPNTQRLVCNRCGNFVGFVKKNETQTDDTVASISQQGNVYKIYLHAVKFLNPNTNLLCDDNNDASFEELHSKSVQDGGVEDFLCQLFHNQSKQFTSFRFIVRSSHEELTVNKPIVLLIWMLDVNLQIYSSKCDLFSDVSFTDVTAARVLKLLYKGCFLDNKDGLREGGQNCVFKAWERDNTVHGLDLPYPLCKQLLSLLIASTHQLPKSQRNLNSFHVGYLHYR